MSKGLENKINSKKIIWKNHKGKKAIQKMNW
jgi:hypothetical protein